MGQSRRSSAKISIDSEQALYLVELVKIRLRYSAIPDDHSQVMGECRCVVPVETPFDDRRFVDDAILGVNRRIGHRAVLLPINQPHPDAGRAQSLRGMQERAVKLVLISYVVGLG